MKTTLLITLTLLTLNSCQQPTNNLKELQECNPYSFESDYIEPKEYQENLADYQWVNAYGIIEDIEVNGTVQDLKVYGYCGFDS